MEIIVKTLLIAINSKYIHSNLAVYYLKKHAQAYSKVNGDGYKTSVKILEYTINQQVENILQSIYLEKPDIIAFSCYIWNIETVESLTKEIRKVLPEVKIWLGGPEVTYNANDYLLSHKEIDGIILGEGEESFKELLDYYYQEENADKSATGDEPEEGIREPILLKEITGIIYRKTAIRDLTNTSGESMNKIDLLDLQDNTNKSTEDKIKHTGSRPLPDFSKVPFPYDDLSHFENRIIYYESSRGCPFSCSYCLSSVDKTMRLRDIELVKQELSFFINHKVKQVKFVDRTFNCNKEHSIAVWKHIIDNDNGITNFHFEIAADLLDEEEIELLKSMRSGLVQLEIGVQSTNPKTIKAINRKTNFQKISENVKRLSEERNVHQHLDLIAGLPFEDYDSFRNSFNDVYELRPEQFQLGFLKVLKGTPIVIDSETHGIVYKDIPPYEVLFTNWINYDQVLKLKLVEEMVEVYYNSGQFNNTILFMEHYFESYFDLYKELGQYYLENELLDIKHSRAGRYKILLEFMESKLKDITGFKEIILFDLYLRENMRKRPEFADEEEKYKEIYGKIYSNGDLREKYLGVKDTKQSLGKAKQYFHLEYFNINIEESVRSGEYVYEPQLILFNYKKRDPLNYNAQTKLVTEEF